jgi:hypothetical protein
LATEVTQPDDDVVLSFHVPAILRQALNQAARQELTSASAIARQAIRDRLRAMDVLA